MGIAALPGTSSRNQDWTGDGRIAFSHHRSMQGEHNAICRQCLTDQARQFVHHPLECRLARGTTGHRSGLQRINELDSPIPAFVDHATGGVIRAGIDQHLISRRRAVVGFGRDDRGIGMRLVHDAPGDESHRGVSGGRAIGCPLSANVRTKAARRSDAVVMMRSPSSAVPPGA